MNAIINEAMATRILNIVSQAVGQLTLDTAAPRLYDEQGNWLTSGQLVTNSYREVKGWHRGRWYGQSSTASNFEAVKEIYLDGGADWAEDEALRIAQSEGLIGHDAQLVASVLVASVEESLERDSHSEAADYASAMADEAMDNEAVRDGADMLHRELCVRAWSRACWAAKSEVNVELSHHFKALVTWCLTYNKVPKERTLGRKFETIWDFKKFVTDELVKSPVLTQEDRESIRSLAYFTGSMSKEKKYYQWAQERVRTGRLSPDIAEGYCTARKIYSFRHENLSQYTHLI